MIPPVARPTPPAIATVTRWQDLTPGQLRGHVAVVLDVLRWSTVVATALRNGADGIECARTPEEALALARRLGRDRALVAGEREARPPDGFDLGNSPGLFSPDRVAGRLIVMTTTNGTNALAQTEGASVRLVGCFANFASIAERLRSERAAGRPVLLVAAGQDGVPTPEDTACAGALAEALGGSDSWSEATRGAVALWGANGRSPARAVHGSPHAATLREAGFEGDLDACATLSSAAVVPEAMSGLRVTRGAPRASHSSGH